jgi:acyl carrier protein
VRNHPTIKEIPVEPYQSVLDTLRGIIEGSVDELQVADLTADGDLAGELGIDSLAMFEIADKAQEQWHIKISDEDISRFTTLDSMVAFILASADTQKLPATAEV